MTSKKENKLYFKNKDTISPSHCVDFARDDHILFSIRWMPYCASFSLMMHDYSHNVLYYRIFEDALYKGIDETCLFNFTIINELTEENLFFGRVPSIVHRSKEMEERIITDHEIHYSTNINVEKFLSEEEFNILSKNEKCEDALMRQYFEDKKPHHQRIYTELYQYYPSLENADH